MLSFGLKAQEESKGLGWGGGVVRMSTVCTHTPVLVPRGWLRALLGPAGNQRKHADSLRGKLAMKDFPRCINNIASLQFWN